MKKLNPRQKRHFRIRKYLAGSKDCPRLSVFRSNQHIYAQLINDEEGKTIASVSDMKIAAGTKIEKAFEIGKKLAEKALKLGVKKIVFDRGGFLYHGRVEKVASGAREGGLEF